MSEQIQQLQSQLIQVKAQAFELYQNLEQSSRQLQSLESAFQHIAQLSGYTINQETGLNGLMQHLQMQFELLSQMRAVPAEAVEVPAEEKKSDKGKSRQKIYPVND